MSAEKLTQTLNGERVFFSEGNFLKHRNLLYAIPLGTTDMLVVQLEMPLADISTIVSVMLSRFAITITIALLIGGYIYYRLIGQILTPAQNMMLATKAISEGNLNYRIENIPTGEFGQLASSFNSMMQNISDLHDHSIEKERELTKAQEELKYKDILEEKNQTIVSTNNELKAHLKEISTLLQLNQAMASTLDLDTLFDRVINSLCELLECHMASLLLYNHGDETLEVSHSIGIPENVLSDICFSLNEGISGETARTHKAIYVKDLKKDKRYLNYKGKLPPEGSLLSMPLLSKDRINGVLNLHHKQVDGFTEDDIKMARAVSNQVAVSIENTQLYELAKKQSITDELTGLANRRHFQDILQREIVHAQRYSSNISMIMIDIDHFKKYNDTHGHLQGDIALKKAASIFLQNTRGIDLTARFGGEEFVILLPKTTIAGARITAEKLREIFEEEPFVGEKESQPGGKMTISLGVASYPDHTDDMNQILDLADRSLYQAKRDGRNRVVIWDNSIPLEKVLS
jgi:diguanylate cyclase (GGDEF)-like protein